MPPRRPVPPTPELTPHLRGRGALLGLSVGDALGVPLKARPLVAPPFPQLADGPHRKLKGGGPFELRRGQVGESGQMASCLGVGLRELGTYDADDMLRRYLAWQGHAVGMSEHTQEVLTEMLESGLPKATAGRRVWMRGQRRAAGNGSLARTAPIGVFFHEDPQAQVQASLADSALTHFDPRCQLACATLNSTIAHALNGGDSLRKEDLLTAAMSGLTVASATLGRSAADFVQEVSAAAVFLKEDLAAARQDDPMLYWPDLHMHRKQDHVRVAFRLAFWELLHAPTFEAGLVDVINRGGDADVNGAVTGALLGAFHGEDAIPSEWRQGVLDSPGPSAGLLWSRYHPRHLLLLAPE
ncbi:ADP-ribosylglycohydrolase family protein [Vitiosangium sp. GDMCC 1.1324]|uniref:ADP-ribosylglycohydrolase family protein n=1 Tax=Vitiosangium sp. (strain GDMCC 1.1324) TaxID=2138576 RepID=UPI000D3B9508|nr:ADP-ribosylglycohydrolase family protein [Vitiosangium sp. GDMCC 1.1324]PTL85236.1 ADP-ribosylglycohydrolase family protein [Vitiosangium sp. GDMCC 1.1324]